MKIMSLEIAIAQAQEAFRNSYTVHTEKWQGMQISEKPEMQTFEVLNHSFSCVIPDALSLPEIVKPNLPWADDHFQERVGGEPLNPGVQWANWPYAKSADRFREQGIFSHTYMERYWARKAQAPTTWGIRYQYGDLNDVINLLHEQPKTRQAFLPVFFPEDTGAVHGGRIPCTLGYHFIMRGGYLHIVYYLRSCDFMRHFRDDVYLTIRLLLWVLEQLAIRNPGDWGTVLPGTYTMHITSLHIFRNDYKVLFGEEPKLPLRVL